MKERYNFTLEPKVKKVADNLANTIGISTSELISRLVLEVSNQRTGRCIDSLERLLLNSEAILLLDAIHQDGLSEKNRTKLDNLIVRLGGKPDATYQDE